MGTAISLGLVPESGGSAITAPMSCLHEEDLLRIFSFLSLGDLLHVSQVCRRWYRLSFDFILWRDVDLKRFASRFTDPVKLDLLILKRFSPSKIQRLDLSGFIISERTLQVLNSSCKQLKALTLKSVTFTSDTNRVVLEETDKGRFFPAKLEYLDIRFSQGHCRVYREIASSCNNIKHLRLCDAFLYTLLKDGSLETTIERMKGLRQLDLSHCRLLKDNSLALFARCSELEVLCLHKCFLLRGSFIQDFLQSCVHLKTLVLDGINIDDDTLQSISWDSCCLSLLELGWLPLVTPCGLKSVLPLVAKIQTLDYLGLCAIGDSKALNDELLLHLAASLSRRSNRKLKWLNVSCSWCITKDSLDRLHPFFEAVDATNCPAAEISYDKNDNVGLFEAGKTRYNRYLSGSDVFRFKWTLETPV